jgi:hypothetical protein
VIENAARTRLALNAAPRQHRTSPGGALNEDIDMSLRRRLWTGFKRRKLWLLPILVMLVVFSALAVISRPFPYQPELLEWTKRPASNVR